MADLFITKLRIKLALWLVGAGVALGALASWDAARQAGEFGDEQRFLLSITITGALALTWFILLPVYFSVQWFMRPDIVKRLQGMNVPWWMLNCVLLLAFIGGMALLIPRLSSRVQNEFSLLEKGKLPALEAYLIKHPEAVEHTDRKTGKTLLELALENNQPAAVDLLLEKGSNLNQVSNGPNWVVSALLSPPLLEALLRHGVDPDLPDTDGLAAIHYAVETLNTNALTLLLKYGADVNARDPLYQTPLLLSIMADQLAPAKILLNHGGDPNLWDRRGDTALHKAVRRRNMDTTRFLLQREADPKKFNFSGQTPLHIAALNGQNELIELLLEDSDGVNLHNEDGRTALDYALRGRKYDTVHLLLQHGAAIDRVLDNGYTAIHLLLIAKEYNSVRFLIEEGASVQIPGPEGETAYDLIRRKQLQGLINLLEEPGQHAAQPSENHVL